VREVEAASVGPIDAEFVRVVAGGDVGVAAGRDIRVDTNRRRRASSAEIQIFVAVRDLI